MEHNEPELQEMAGGFRRMLERALDARTPHSSSERAEFYDRAREALRRHLAGLGLDDAASSATEQARALEQAIGQIEAAASGAAADEKLSSRTDAPTKDLIVEEGRSDTSPAEGLPPQDIPAPEPGPAVARVENQSSTTSEEGAGPRKLFDETGVGDPEPSLFDGAVAIADEDSNFSSPEALSSQRGASGLGGPAIVAIGVAVIVATGFYIGDPRRIWIDRNLDQIRFGEELSVTPNRELARSIAEETHEDGLQSQLRSLIETDAATGVTRSALPQATLHLERGAPAEEGQSVRGAAGNADRIEVAFPEHGLELGFRVGLDRAPNGTVREVVSIDIAEAPEPIVNLSASSLIIRGKDREISIEGLPVRLGMHRVVIGLMDRIGPLLREQEAYHAVLGFQLLLASGRRLTLAVPLEAELFAPE